MRSFQAQEDYGEEKSLQEIRLKWKVTQNELAVVEQTNMWVQPAVFPVEEDSPLVLGAVQTEPKGTLGCF